LKDTYKTIADPSEPILLKEKNSKFFGYAFPVDSEEQIKLHLDALRKTHPQAGHYCYAYQIGIDKVKYRANDDGEPANTAGPPIYGQIQSNVLTNILIVVVRIFGGTKLGVGGLIAAYRESARRSIEAAHIVERTIDVKFQIQFDYKNMNKVMRIIKEKNLQIIAQDFTENCRIEVAVRKKDEAKVKSVFEQILEIRIIRKE
jgi:uncharacterized YigZ family protein